MKKNIILFSVFLLGLVLFGAKTQASENFYNLWQLNGDQAYQTATSTYNYATSSTYYFRCDNPHMGYGYAGIGPTPMPILGVRFNSNSILWPISSSSNVYWFTTATGTPDSDVRLENGPYNNLACDQNPLVISGVDTFSVSKPTIDFLYPQNSTSTYIHDFSYFTFKATNIDTITHTFRFKVIYDTTSTFDNIPVSVSRNVDYAFGAGLSHYLNIPKPGDLTSSTIYYAKVCSNTDGDLTWSCNDPISFQTGALSPGYHINTETAGFYGSTTTEAGIMYPTSTTDITAGSGLICGTEFYNPANWACWGAQRVYAIWNDLKDFAVGIFEQGWNGLKAVFPLNILSHFSEDLNAVSVSTSTIDSLTLTGQGSAFKHDSGYYSFTFLTSSTLKESENATGFDWESLVVYFLWAITGLFIVFSAIILIQKAGHNTKK